MDGPFLQQAIEYLMQGEVEGFLMSVPNGNTTALQAVIENSKLLRSLGLYESGLTAAFNATRTNNLAYPVWYLELLFCSMDPERVEAIKPLPAGEEFRIYRGVAGDGEARRVNGLSWTGRIECAAWFAMRFNLPDPAIYAATVPRDEVWWHDTERDEDEFVVRPRTPERLPLSLEELRELQAKHAHHLQQTAIRAIHARQPALHDAP
jgi:hypothetical protein